MEHKPGNRRYFKRGLITAGILLSIFFCLQWWFVNNARNVLKNYISEQSDGKIKLELEKLNLNLLTKRLQIINGDLQSTDSATAPVSYHVNFSRLSVNVGSMWALLFKKELMLDSLKIYNPRIRVTQWRKDSTRLRGEDKLSIPQELGKVYNALLGALNEFSVRRIIINNASVKLVSKVNKDSEPVDITNIYFDLARKYEKINDKYVFAPGDQSIELRTTNQDIALPDDRHRLSFKSFRLQLIGQKIEMDSCTVTAMATDSLKSNYKIFYNKLYLSGVDFPALSAKNLIKADTVYCQNPVFDFNIYRDETAAKKSETPDPRKIIGELSGNLDLGLVEIEQAGIHFNLYGKIDRSFFNSNKDNFQIHGLRVNPDSSYPVSLRNINMVLRDYQLYNQDSSSSFSFDSLHLDNNDIILNNFAVQSYSGRKTLRNDINIRVPYFELSNLDWYQLIFNEYLIARTALLKDPVVDFTRRKSGVAGRKFNLFDALLSLDNQAGLENVTVLNGTMNMRLGPTSAFKVSSIDFRVNSNKVLSSTTKENLRNAVEYLSFKQGELRLKDISAQMQNAQFTNDNRIYADRVAITGKDNIITADVQNVFIDNMQMDDNADTIEVDGFRWEKADVVLRALPAVSEDNNGISSIYLKNISGLNTRLQFSNKNTTLSTFLNSLKAASFQRKGDGLILVDGFAVAGKDLVIDGKEVNIQADSYRLTGSDSSFLNTVRLLRLTGDDTLDIRTAGINFSTDLNKLFANDLHFNYVNAYSPVINMSRNDNTLSGNKNSALTQPPIRIDRLNASTPDITLVTTRDDSSTVLRVPATENSLFSATDILITGPQLEIGAMKVNTNSATFVNRSGSVSGVEDGKIVVDLSSIKFGKQAGKMNWSGIINTLDIENADGITLNQSKSNIYFQSASLGNISLSSDYLPNFSELLKVNVSAWLRIPEGQYVDSINSIQWYNANYSSANSTLDIDSINYHPTRSLDSAMAIANFEFDYITLKTGAVSIKGLDAEQFEENSSIIANSIIINQPEIVVYRNKQLPDAPMLIKKPLPVDLIKSLTLPVLVNEMELTDARISYTEKNDKSGREGNLVLTNIQASVKNIKNNNITPDDSLRIEFNARLMNAVDLSLNLNESYSDTMSTFSLSAEFGEADLTMLNPFLGPVASVHIRSGRLDSGRFQMTADKNVSIGDMNLHYEDLKIRVLKNGDPDKSAFLQNAMSFLANTFLIRNDSKNRSGIIFYELKPGQSFIKYSIKSFISGVASNVGVKKNKRKMRRYERGL